MPSLAGHFYPEVGRGMEDELSDLLDRLGFIVLRKRDVKLNLDIIAKFGGKPIKPIFDTECSLLKPFFCPNDNIAFSLKRGDFVKGDVDEVIEKVQKAKNESDEALKAVNGGVIVTNYTKTEDELDKTFKRGVYCWDGRRLIFYAAKARTVSDLWARGPLSEIKIDNIPNTTYLIQKETLHQAILTNISVFIDNHDKQFMVSYDEMCAILSFIYKTSLKPIVDSCQLDVQVVMRMHVLGIAEFELIGKAYREYAYDKINHPQVTLSANPKVFQYASAPWAALIEL